MIRLSLRNNRLKFKTGGKLSIILVEFIREYALISSRKTGGNLQTLGGLQSLMPKNLPDHCVVHASGSFVIIGGASIIATLSGNSGAAANRGVWHLTPSLYHQRPTCGKQIQTPQSCITGNQVGKCRISGSLQAT